MLVAFSTPATGTTAQATTDMRDQFAVDATLIQCAAINCLLSLGNLSTRSIIIERIDKNDQVLVSASYQLPNVGGNDRALTFPISVAIFPGAKLRARFDGCDAGETQWIVINYRFARPGSNNFV